MDKKQKEQISALIDKKVKEKQDKLMSHNLFFIAFSIFFGALIQILIYYYTNTKYLIPYYFKFLIYSGVVFPMIFLYFILSDLLDRVIKEKKRIFEILTALSLVVPIFLIGVFILNQGPKAYLSYQVNCPASLTSSGTNISVYVENRGETIATFEFFASSNANISIVDLYSASINSDFISNSTPLLLRILPSDKTQPPLTFPIFIKANENLSNISVTNFFYCDKSTQRDCVLTRMRGNENKCEYIKKNGVYQKINRYIFVNT